MLENILLSAFLMGFLGSTHCIAMCSGIVGVLSQRGEPLLPSRGDKAMGVVVTYNVGRIFSYCCIGFLAGFIGQLGLSFLDKESALFFSKLFTATFMASFGLSLLGWPSFLPFLERKGHYIWRLISPNISRFLPIQSLRQSLMLGLIWGWLPCGLVYSAVAMSLSTSQVVYGGVTMLFFGLGTLPAMLFMGLASHKLNQLKKSVPVRRVAGLIVIVLAVVHLSSAGFPWQSMHALH